MGRIKFIHFLYKKEIGVKKIQNRSDYLYMIQRNNENIQ